MGRGAGSSSWTGETQGPSMVKNLHKSTSLMMWGMWEMVAFEVRRGGIHLMDCPLRQAVASQRLLEVAWYRKS